MSAVEQVFREIEDWRTGKLWGAKRIADEAGVSEKTIARWARLNGCPVTIVNGRFFCLRLDLMLWMTSKRTAECPEMSDVG